GDGYFCSLLYVHLPEAKGNEIFSALRRLADLSICRRGSSCGPCAARRRVQANLCRAAARTGAARFRRKLSHDADVGHGEPTWRGNAQDGVGASDCGPPGDRPFGTRGYGGVLELAICTSRARPAHWRIFPTSSHLGTSYAQPEYGNRYVMRRWSQGCCHRVYHLLQTACRLRVGRICLYLRRPMDVAAVRWSRGTRVLCCRPAIRQYKPDCQHFG